jgi:mannan endo-1,4-beta-mannosidase
MIARILLVAFVFAVSISAQTVDFVTVRGHALFRSGNEYRFVGANYWYAPLLPLESDSTRGLKRLRKELDFLRKHGVTNLRLMAGSEGSGEINAVTRVGPSLQPEQGKFSEDVLRGLDQALVEIGKRHMTAVVVLSNNWEWTGGFQQYLLWNGMESARFITQKPTWDEYRTTVATFYLCGPCKDAYRKQVETMITRKNNVSGKLYSDDPAIMAWELANEPRPMRPAVDLEYKQWISDTAAFIKSRDTHHLVTIGHEGWIGTESLKLYEDINADKNLDYLTIHIWPKNWGWLTGKDIAKDFPNIIAQTTKYIADNTAVAQKLDKPMVIEEFGLPRDGVSFDPDSHTTFRDQFFAKILSHLSVPPAVAGGAVDSGHNIVGANFWAFAGTARPIKNQTFWKPGDAYTGDPPMEEQGLNSVFNSDHSTWKVIKATSPNRRKH